MKNDEMVIHAIRATLTLNVVVNAYGKVQNTFCSHVYVPIFIKHILSLCIHI